MNQLAERQIASLQAEIRRAGERTAQVRALLRRRVLRLTSPGTLVFAVYVMAQWFWPHGSFWKSLLAVMELSLLGLLSLVFFPQPALLLRRHRRAFARKLAALPPPERAAVLLPLRRDRVADTRKLTTSLLREFGLPTEVTPATLPPGRGDEARPAA